MNKRMIVLAGCLLVAHGVSASVMSLVEAKDKLTVISAHELEARRDYDAAKLAYKRQKQARKTAAREVKAIAKANAASQAAEQASLQFMERAHHMNPYLDEQYLGSGIVRIKGVQND